MRSASFRCHFGYLPASPHSLFAGSMKSPTMLPSCPLLRGTHDFAASRDVSPDPPCDPQTMTLRCLIIDDSRCFLAAARSLLERQGMMIVGVATSTAEALQRGRGTPS